MSEKAQVKKENLIAKNVAELIKVKTIITFAIVYGVVWGFMEGKIGATAFMGLAGAVVGYYFSKFQNSAK